MKKLTDNEIIKALECCSQEDMCQSCPYGAACLDEKYVSILSKDALDLINRQKAEISALKSDLILKTNDYEHLKKEYEKTENVSVARKDRLMQTVVKLQASKAEIVQWKEEANKYQNLWCEAVKDMQSAKSETIKEFADKYKFYVRKYESGSSVPLDAVLFVVDYVYEKMSYEMVGDDNA